MIVAISGKPQTGKKTLCQFLIQGLSKVNHEKRFLAYRASLDSLPTGLARGIGLQEKLSRELIYKMRSHLLRSFGAESYVAATLEGYVRCRHIVIVPDVQNRDEFKVLKACGAITLRVERPTGRPLNFDHYPDHLADEFHDQLVCNTGGLDSLEFCARHLVEHLVWPRVLNLRAA